MYKMVDNRWMDGWMILRNGLRIFSNHFWVGLKSFIYLQKLSQENNEKLDETVLQHIVKLILQLTRGSTLIFLPTLLPFLSTGHLDGMLHFVYYLKGINSIKFNAITIGVNDAQNIVPKQHLWK